MQHSVGPLTWVVIIAAALTHPSAMKAQSNVPPRVSPTVGLLEALSYERAARWQASTPVIRCAPAPLTERPGSPGELARPRIAPLEAAFFDAVRVKGLLAQRAWPSWQ